MKVFIFIAKSIPQIRVWGLFRSAFEFCFHYVSLLTLIWSLSIDLPWKILFQPLLRMHVEILCCYWQWVLQRVLTNGDIIFTTIKIPCAMPTPCTYFTLTWLELRKSLKIRAFCAITKSLCKPPFAVKLNDIFVIFCFAVGNLVFEEERSDPDICHGIENGRTLRWIIWGG